MNAPRCTKSLARHHRTEEQFVDKSEWSPHCCSL